MSSTRFATGILALAACLILSARAWSQEFKTVPTVGQPSVPATPPPAAPAVPPIPATTGPTVTPTATPATTPAPGQPEQPPPAPQEGQAPKKERGRFVLAPDAHYTLLTGEFGKRYRHGPGGSLLIGYGWTESKLMARIGLLSRFSWHPGKAGFDSMYRMGFNLYGEFLWRFGPGVLLGGDIGIGMGHSTAYYKGAKESTSAGTWKFVGDRYGTAFTVLMGGQFGYRVRNFLDLTMVIDIDMMAKKLPDQYHTNDDKPSFIEAMFVFGLRATFLI